MNNLKQLSLGMLMYADDHDELLPHYESWTDAQNVGAYAGGKTRAKGPYYCPSDQGEDLLDATHKWRWDGSYAAVEDLTGSNWRKRSVRLRELVRPDYRVMFIEQKPANVYNSTTTTWYTSWGRRDMRHHDGHVIAHFDGVVRWYPNPITHALPRMTWLSTPGDWRYGAGQPTDSCLTAFSGTYPTSSWVWKP